ncbi:MAG: hypothetical protein ACK55I_45865, partial [bacterium]
RVFIIRRKERPRWRLPSSHERDPNRKRPRRLHRLAAHTDAARWQRLSLNGDRGLLLAAVREGWRGARCLREHETCGAV